MELNPAELRIDTFRASGAGGQHVNKTDSAIRITHLPTGIVVECQDERSQHKNRSRAMSLLRARLRESEQQRQTAQQAQERRLQVGTGDRSERIRTYNFPQGRVTDHRIGLTLHKIDRVMLGEFDEIVDALTAEDEAALALAGRAPEGDEEVARCVSLEAEAALLREGGDVGGDAILDEGGSGDRADFLEDSEGGEGGGRTHERGSTTEERCY